MPKTAAEQPTPSPEKGTESELVTWRKEIGSWRMAPLQVLAMLARIEAEVRQQQMALEEHAERVRDLDMERRRLERTERSLARAPLRREGKELIEEREKLIERCALEGGAHQRLGRRHRQLLAKLKVLERMGASSPPPTRPDPVDLLAGDLMTPDVITVQEDLPLPEGAAVLIDHEITGAVVVDAEGHPVGVLSTTDVALAASEAEAPPGSQEADFFLRGTTPPQADSNLPELPESMAEIRVGDVMNPELYAVAEDTPAAEVARRMVDEHIHRLLVTRGDQLVGIISSSDMLGLLIE